MVLMLVKAPPTKMIIRSVKLLRSELVPTSTEYGAVLEFKAHALCPDKSSSWLFVFGNTCKHQQCLAS
jgi:hypothetical protein